MVGSFVRVSFDAVAAAALQLLGYDDRTMHVAVRFVHADMKGIAFLSDVKDLNPTWYQMVVAIVPYGRKVYWVFVSDVAWTAEKMVQTAPTAPAGHLLAWVAKQASDHVRDRRQYDKKKLPLGLYAFTDFINDSISGGGRISDLFARRSR
jgi:hypothetical protein